MHTPRDPEWITIEDTHAEEITLGQYEIDFFPETNRAYVLSASPFHDTLIVEGDTPEERRADCIRKAHAMLVGMLHEFEADAAEIGVDLL